MKGRLETEFSDEFDELVEETLKFFDPKIPNKELRKKPIFKKLNEGQVNVVISAAYAKKIYGTGKEGWDEYDANRRFYINYCIIREKEEANKRN